MVEISIIIFKEIPIISHFSPCVVHDCVESVGDCENCALLKLHPDGALDEVICLQVHGRRGLVQNQDLGLPEQGAGKAHQLSLTNTEITQVYYKL